MVRLFLKEWREHRGLQQKDLAARAGINDVTVSRMEHEQFRWTSEHLEQLALALDIDDARKLLYPPE